MRWAQCRYWWTVSPDGFLLAALRFVRRRHCRLTARTAPALAYAVGLASAGRILLGLERTAHAPARQGIPAAGNVGVTQHPGYCPPLPPRQPLRLCPLQPLEDRW